jgi:gliding motility-associated lipoprotein GldD
MWLNLKSLLFIFLVYSCQSAPPTIPKPRAFPKIEFPEKKYVSFDENYCQFTFEMPEYTEIEQDTLFFDERPAHPCWFNIFYPDFNCRIYCSYYPINTENPFSKLNKDAFSLAMEHSRKATYIDEVKFEKPNGVSGFIFNLEGPVATPFQFYMTDSTHHFLRGALYFSTQIRPDSLAPLYEFVKIDISHMINTFTWME